MANRRVYPATGSVTSRNPIDLRDPAGMARFAGERRCQPARHCFFGLVERQKPQAQGKCIGVVVLARRGEDIEMFSGAST